MIGLDVNSIINVDKISTKLDLGSFTNEQNNFAKVFETASKSFEATKKSLDKTVDKQINNANKTISKEKTVNNKKTNQQKEKISDDKQENKQNISDNDEQNSSKEVTSEDKKVQDEQKKSKVNEKETKQENNNENNQQSNSEQKENTEADVTVQTVEATAILEDIVHLGNTFDETKDIPVQDWKFLTDEEFSAGKKAEGLNRIFFSKNSENHSEVQLSEKTTNQSLEHLLTTKEQSTGKIDLKHINLLQKTNNNTEVTTVLSEQETQNVKEPNLLEKLLFGKKQEVESNKLTEQNIQDLRETSEKLLSAKVQSADLTQKVIDELKVSDNKLLTQNPIHTLSGKNNIFKHNNEFLLKHDGTLNLQNLSHHNLKAETETNLSEVMTELDIDTDADIQVDITNSSLDNQTSEHNQEFNFNSSSFTDLNSHITKLSLNKTADFSKVMNTKTIQQHDNQILNQVKEATANTLSKSTTSVSIILKPENLGRVHVNLVSQNGVLTAQLTAQTQQTADALNRNIETLRQNLVDQGVKIAEVSVKVQETSESSSLLSNDSNSFEDKLGQTKEQYQSKHNHKNQFDKNLKDDNNYIYNNSNNDDAEETTTSSHIRTNNTNNDLGLYNNMGRTL